MLYYTFLRLIRNSRSLHLNMSFVIQSEKNLFHCVSGDWVFTHTGMTLGKPDPMLIDPIIWLETLCEFEHLLSAQANYSILIHLSTNYFNDFFSLYLAWTFTNLTNTFGFMFLHNVSSLFISLGICHRMCLIINYERDQIMNLKFLSIPAKEM